VRDDLGGRTDRPVGCCQRCCQLVEKHIDHVAAMAHARPAVGASTGAAARFTLCATPPTSGWTSTCSARIDAATSAPTASQMTSTRPAPAEWRAPPHSSSTAAANTAPTTSTPSPRQSRRQRLRRNSTCRIVPGHDQKPADGVHGSAWQRLVDPCSGRPGVLEVLDLACAKINEPKPRRSGLIMYRLQSTTVSIKASTRLR